VAESHLVTGIAESSHPTHLEDKLCGKDEVNCDKLTVITADDPTEEHHSSILEYIFAGELAQTSDVSHDVIRGDTAIMTDSGGVNVPGISADTRYIGFFAHPHVINHLANFPIPADQIENYNDAIDEGRSVVTYKATAQEAPVVEKAFKDAGLRNVKTFNS